MLREGRWQTRKHFPKKLFRHSFLCFCAGIKKVNVQRRAVEFKYHHMFALAGKSAFALVALFVDPHQKKSKIWLGLNLHDQICSRIFKSRNMIGREYFCSGRYMELISQTTTPPLSRALMQSIWVYFVELYFSFPQYRQSHHIICRHYHLQELSSIHLDMGTG